MNQSTQPTNTTLAQPHQERSERTVTISAWLPSKVCPRVGEAVSGPVKARHILSQLCLVSSLSAGNCTRAAESPTRCTDRRHIEPLAKRRIKSNECCVVIFAAIPPLAKHRKPRHRVR